MSKCSISKLRQLRLFGLSKDLCGGIAIEFVLIAPLLILLMAGIAQAGSLFFLRHEMYETAHDTARRVAVAELTESEAETRIKSALQDWQTTFSITVDASNPASNDVDVTVSVPMRDVVFLDLFNLFATGTIAVGATMRRES